MAILQRSEKSVTELQSNSVDKLFETFKTLKESEDKMKQVQTEHLDTVSSINNKNMLDPSASFLVDPKTNQAVPIPPDLNAMRQAGFQKGAEIEAQKQATTFELYRKLGMLGTPQAAVPTQVATAMGKPVMSNQTAVGGSEMPAIPNELPIPGAMPQMVPSINAKGKMSLRGIDPNSTTRTNISEERNKIATANRMDRLEKNYIQNMNSVISSNQKPAGLQNSKVNQALDLRKMIDGSYDKKSGEYKIPPAQHTELAIGLARLLSPTGVIAQDLVNRLEQGTLRQKLSNVAIYMGADPKEIGGTTQSITKFLINSIDRQGELAEDIRDKAIAGAKEQYQSGLPKEQRERLSKINLTSSYRDYLKNSKEQPSSSFSDDKEKRYQAWKAAQNK